MNKEEGKIFVKSVTEDVSDRGKKLKGKWQVI